MKKLFLLIAGIALGGSVWAQTFQYEPDPIPSIHLDGPRIGVTILTGNLAQKMENEYQANPIISQFGWQFESQYFTLDNGTAGVVEFVTLLGGLEQNLFIPSASLLVGLRSAKGFEVGVGPNVSVGGASFVLAGGYTFSSNGIHFPINLAFVPGKDGARLSLLLGFNAVKRTTNTNTNRRWFNTQPRTLD
jgi:hypothetical protein